MKLDPGYRKVAGVFFLHSPKNEFGLPTCPANQDQLASSALVQARLRPLGYGAAAFAACEIDLILACRAVACASSEGWCPGSDSNRHTSRYRILSLVVYCIYLAVFVAISAIFYMLLCSRLCSFGGILWHKTVQFE